MLAEDPSPESLAAIERLRAIKPGEAGSDRRLPIRAKRLPKSEMDMIIEVAIKRRSGMASGRTVHADVNSAQIITGRQSSGSGLDRSGKGEILRSLVKQHTERWPEITTRHHGRKGTADDPRLTNRYFADCAASARKLQQILGLVPFGLMQ